MVNALEWTCRGDPIYSPYLRVDVNALHENKKDVSLNIRNNISLGVFPALAFSFAYFIFMITGFGCIASAPDVRIDVSGFLIDTKIHHTTCYRAFRRANYVGVELVVGTPARKLELLLRLDTTRDVSTPAVRILNDRVIESHTFSCKNKTTQLVATHTLCRDIIFATAGGPRDDIRKQVLEFEYVNAHDQQSLPETGLLYSLGMAGEWYPKSLDVLHLTNTHLCVTTGNTAPSPSTPSLRAFRLGPERSLWTTAQSIANVKTGQLMLSPVRNELLTGACDTLAESMVELFPISANLEPDYLTLSDASLWGVSPIQVQGRRAVVELGIECSSQSSKLQREHSSYITDCIGLRENVCRTLPSVPFRRISSSDVRAVYNASGSASFWFADNPTLTELPGLADSADAVLLAWMKLGMLVLAAIVTWVRADRATSQVRWLYEHCLSDATQRNINTQSDKTPSLKPIEDAVVGLAAVIARAVVSCWRLAPLLADNQGRVCVVNIFAATLSLLNWIIRNLAIQPTLYSGRIDQTDEPLGRLGGSMAVTDATSAVLLAYSSPPTLLTGSSNFDATARLLTGVTSVLIVLQRCLFGVAGISLLLAAERRRKQESRQAIYEVLLATSISSWIFQTAAVAVTIADLVVAPMAKEMTRGYIGNKTLISRSLFITFVCASLPRLLKTCVSLARSPRS